jgi:hypothetical protein
MEIKERRTPTQGEGAYYLSRDRWKGPTQFPGTISWEEHEEAYLGYAKRFPSSARDQDAEKIAQRGGFGYWEATEYLGQ